jgi:hypothetical protein
MKKLFVLIVFLFATICLWSQEIAVVTHKPGALPSVKWLSDSVLSMGRLVLNNQAKVTFEFENNGEAPLVISKVETSCGCTSVDYPKDPINPGKKGYVKTTYNAVVLGFFSKTLVVHLNTSERSKVLYIKGEVVKPN